jgi:hypothetical protein
VVVDQATGEQTDVRRAMALPLEKRSDGASLRGRLCHWRGRRDEAGLRAHQDEVGPRRETCGRHARGGLVVQ